MFVIIRCRICRIKINIYHYVLIQMMCRIEYDIQPDQINMAEFFWYLLKSDASVRDCTVAYKV